MRYVPDAQLGDTPHIRIGSLPEGAPAPAFHLGAAPDIRLPTALQADTVTGQALHLLRRQPATGLPGVIACIDYSGDHLLASWTLSEPAEALSRAPLAEQAARACLYGLATNDTLAQIACFFDSYPREAGITNTADLFATLLPEVPALLDNPRSQDLYWIGDYSDVIQANSVLNSGAVRIEEHPELDLAVLHTPLRLHDLTRLTAAPFSRMLQVRSENTYLLEYRRESWVRYPPGRPLPRIDLRPLRSRLSLFERAAGAWHADPLDQPVSRLFLDAGRGVASPSLIDAETLVAEVLDYLRVSARKSELQWTPGAAYP